MSIRRTPLPFEGQFTQVPNAWLRDQRLSRRARGLLAEIMSHQHGWVISVHSLWKNGPEGREAIRKAIVELADAGYLDRDQEHGERGRFGEMNYVLAAPELSTATVAQKLGDGTKTGARSTVAQESATKNTMGKNTIRKEGADAPPPPETVDVPAPAPIRTCLRHPVNSDEPCRECKADRVAQLTWEQSLVAGSRSEIWQPTTKPVKHIPGLCDAHRQPVDTCDACDYERKHA